MAKITIATVKSFIKKNREKLLINQHSSFDGMQDCVVSTNSPGFSPAVAPIHEHSNNLNVQGVWFVGGGRDWCSAFSTEALQGFKVSNCCGSFTVAVAK